MGSRVLCLLVLVGCIDPAGYPCTKDSQCDTRPMGVCELADGFCSYPDGDCPSGSRFESRAPGTLGGACVPVVEGTSTGSTGSTDETSTGPPACGGGGEPCCAGEVCDGAMMECAGDGCGCTEAVFVGQTHACVKQLDATVKCWGGNTLQELGQNDTAQFNPEHGPVDGLPNPVILQDLDADFHTCAIALGGSVYCWGANSSGQANPDTAPDPVPEAVRVATANDLGWEPFLVATGAAHSCVADGEHVLCWGNNDAGQLGVDSAGVEEVDATQFEGRVAEIVAGGGHTCVRTGPLGAEGPSDRAYCWGWDESGQLGAGPTDQTSWLALPVELPAEEPILSLTAGDVTTCALVGSPEEAGERDVYCWGGNDEGAVGGEVAAAVHTPRTVPGVDRGMWFSLSAGAGHACVVGWDGTWCWGNNEAGRVGPNAGPGILGPTRLPIDLERGRVLYSVSAGLLHSCGASSDGTVQCWGSGALGQLGPESPLSFDETVGAWGTVVTACP